MKILHLSVFRQLSAGQRQQLRFEREAARTLSNDTWEVIALHNGAPSEDFERRIPRVFRPVLLRGLYAWLLMLKLSGRYDIVLCRHMTFDPFALLFSSFISNRASVHHAKEIEELRLIRTGLLGRLASWLERHAGAVAVRSAVAIVGVTEDIRQYQMEVRKVAKPSYVYPNGIEFRDYPAVADQRCTSSVHAAFVCETFAAWHGLDLLLDAAKSHPVRVLETRIKIHLIGKLSPAQTAEVSAINRVNDIFVVHGLMHSRDYEPVLAKCDVGIGSLAMFRQGLREGATLKVREYLARGLPVFASHKDTALPVDFEFYTNEACTIDSILECGLRAKGTSRECVRNSALPYVDKEALMRGMMQWLATEFAPALRPAGQY